MGMFDEIRIEYPLPAGYEDMQDRLFQTKSLECLMDCYRLGKDGSLYLQLYETVPENERNADGFPVVRATGEWELVNMSAFHGDIYFYTSRIKGDHEHGLVTFAARWTEGQFTRVFVVTDPEKGE